MGTSLVPIFFTVYSPQLTTAHYPYYCKIDLSYERIIYPNVSKKMEEKSFSCCR